jgi:PIN domain
MITDGCAGLRCHRAHERHDARVGIYLDANVLWRWRTFTEPDRLALSIVAHQLGQVVFVPWVAVREVEEDYRRTLQAALDLLKKSGSEVEALFGAEVHFQIEPWPEVEDIITTWRRRLEEFATILPLDPEDAINAFEREIMGSPPAKRREARKPGRGGRDAAIWLTVARHHSRSKEDGHLLSGDGDMSNSHSQLHADMREDIRASHELHVYKNINAFLVRLGKSTPGRFATLEDLATLDTRSIGEWLNESIEVTRAIWTTLQPDLEYSSIISDARPIDILSQDRYTREGEAVIVVNTRWELDIDCRYRPRGTRTPAWSVIQGVEVTAAIQMFIEEREAVLRPPQVIGAQVSSEESLFLNSDGSVIVTRPYREDF